MLLLGVVVLEGGESLEGLVGRSRLGLLFRGGLDRDYLGVGEELVAWGRGLVVLEQVLDDGRVPGLGRRLGQSVVDLLVQDDDAPVLAHAVVLRGRPALHTPLAHRPVQVLGALDQVDVGRTVLLADQLGCFGEAVNVLVLGVGEVDALVDTLAEAVVQGPGPLVTVLAVLQGRLFALLGRQGLFFPETFLFL